MAELSDTHVLICGAGIAGLTAAWWLHRYGARVDLVDQTSRFGPAGSMTAMYGEALQVAEAMGLTRDFTTAAYRQDTQILHDARGRTLRTYDLRAAHARQQGTLTLRRADWHRILHEALPSDVSVRAASTVARLDQQPDGVDVTFADGATGRYDLVLGADGISSTVRTQVFGGGHRQPLGYGLMTFILDHADARRRRAGLTPHAVHEWFLPGRYVELTTLDADTIAAIFVYPSLPEHRVPAPVDRPTVLAERFTDAPPAVAAVIAAATDPALIYCDDLAQVQLPAWHNGRVALLGDAAHALSPMLGAAGSKAMRGAYTLVRELAAGPTDPAAALTRYERALRPGVEQLQKATRQMASFALTDNRAVAALRATLFRYLPAGLVVKMRTAPPPGTAATPVAAH